MQKLKILHTSDWHLGRTLYGRKRYREFAAFLDWLAAAINEEQVDVLLIAGDVFDTPAPSNRAQALYYRFLCRIAASPCRHVVVIAGNHDSPSFLNAPRELLRALDVHVLGAATAERADEVLLLRDRRGQPELIVCAVPYLRDRDLRLAEADESLEDKERKLLAGIRDHYTEVAAIAEQTGRTSARETGSTTGRIPLVAMGHLFASGGQTVEGDGVRELYIGSLAHIPAGLLPESFDYLALGHLHVPQQLGGSPTRRYSGSPLPLGFGEAGRQKSVCLIEVCAGATTVQLRPVPVFQRLERVAGDWETILARLGELAAEQDPAWLEIVYDGEEVITDLRRRLDAAVADSGLEILRIMNNRIIERVLSRNRADETLDDLEVDEVFSRCLAAHRVPEPQQPELRRTYREAVASLLSEDRRAE